MPTINNDKPTSRLLSVRSYTRIEMKYHLLASHRIFGTGLRISLILTLHFFHFAASHFDMVRHRNGTCELRWTITERIRQYGYYGQYRIKKTPMVIYHCCDGYRLKGGFNNGLNSPCSPICEPPCVNANCTKPGECECWSGYKKRVTSNSVCDIFCSPPCVNSTCHQTPAGSTCFCKDGYEPTDELHKCAPLCTKGCTNGDCVAPDKCSCHDKYAMSPTDASICMPVCSLECINGFCSAPDECTCFNGYKLSDEWNFCDPVCNKTCTYGDCIAPELCSCWTGYSKTEEPNRCEPICTETCVNGNCCNPDECCCRDGFELINNTKCVPYCSQGCANGFCSAPDICTCYEGFVMTENESICEPYCSQPCVNGNCTAPDECTCWLGYENTTNTHYCQPICEEDCINGECTSPNLCSCKDGYEELNSTACIPVCSEPCTNGYCSNPEICTCDPGYRWDNETCSPFCPTECINGRCTAPYVCSCEIDDIKISPFHCVKTCNESMQNVGCSNYSQSFIDWSSLAIDPDNFTVKIENWTIPFTVPCSNSHYMDFQCFVEAEEDKEEIILACHMGNSAFNAEEKQSSNYSRPMNETSTFQGLIMKFLWTENNLCSASLCPESNRILRFNEAAQLTLCYNHPEIRIQPLTGGRTTEWLAIGLGSLFICVLLCILAGLTIYNKFLKKVVYKMEDSCLLNEETEMENTPISAADSNVESSGEIQPTERTMDQ